MSARSVIGIPLSSPEEADMDYLLSVIDAAVDTATPDEAHAIDSFNERLQAEGRWVYANGLADPTTACIVDARRGPVLVDDGPLVQTSEFFSGLWIVDADDDQHALELARAASKACNRRVQVQASLG